jgi:hypothetical protein
MVPEPIHAGSIADGAPNTQAAGQLMDEDGTNRCQSHKLKALYEEIERKDAEFALHISHLAKLFVSVFEFYECEHNTSCSSMGTRLSRFSVVSLQ